MATLVATAAELNAAYTAASSSVPSAITLTSTNSYDLGTKTWNKPVSILGQTYSQDQALLNVSMPYTVKAVFNIGELAQCKFAGFNWNGETTVSSGSMLIYADNFTMEDMVMWNRTAAGVGGSIGITVGNYISGTSYQAANVIMRRNRFMRFGNLGDANYDHPIYAKNCDGLVVEDSLFHDNTGYPLHLYTTCKNGRFRRLTMYNNTYGVTFSGDVGNASTGSTACNFSNGNIMEDCHILRGTATTHFLLEKYFPCGTGIVNNVNNTNIAQMGGPCPRIQSGLAPQVTTSGITDEVVTFVDTAAKDFRITSGSVGATQTKGPIALRPTTTTTPGNPGAFTCVAGAGGSGIINVSWSAASGTITGYEIIRKIGSFPSTATDGTLAYTGTGLGFSDTGLTIGVTYFYRAYAKNGSIYSSGTNSQSGGITVPATVAPANPTNFIVVPGNTLVNLSWTNPAVGTFDTVNVRYKIGSPITGPSDGTSGYTGTGVTTSITGLTNATAYYFAIFATKNSVNSTGQISSPNPVTPTAPVGGTIPNVTGFTATAAGVSQINLAWTNPTPGTFNTVMIRRKLGSNPSSITDGSLVYDDRQFTDVVENVVTGLDTVWSIDWAPDSGHLFITERPGRLKVWDGSTTTTVLTLATEVISAEEGLQGMCLDPNWPTDKYIYLYYSYGTSSNIQNRVVRYLYNSGTKTVGAETILINAIPGFQFHVGGRIRFGPDGKLYVLTGDAANNNDSGAARAQDNASLAGKILRINKDGTIPTDNPISGSPVWTNGHRNPQGIAWNVNGDTYATEHGPTSSSAPDAHDELNRIVKGGNYGWPKYYGNLANPLAFAQALTVTNPIYPVANSENQVWAPGDTEFYKSNLLGAQWNGKVLISGLGIEGRSSDGFLDGRCIYRIPLTGTDLRTPGVLERVFLNLYGRIRALRQGPDGNLYFGTSNLDGRGNGTSDTVKRIRASTTLTASFSNTGLNGATQYFYTAFSILNSDVSTGVSANATTTGTATPNVPTNFVALPGNTLVNLSWTAPSGTYTNVVIRRKTGSPVASVTDGSQIYSGTGTTFQDIALSNGTPYYYAIYTVSSGVNSALVASAVNPVTPSASTTVSGVTDFYEDFNAITNGQPPSSLIWDTQILGAASTSTALVAGTAPNKYVELSYLPATQGYYSIQKKIPLLIDSVNPRGIGVTMYEDAVPDITAGTWESTRFVIHKTLGLDTTGDDTHYIRVKQRGTTATVERKLPTITTPPEVMATITGLPVGTAWELWFEIGPQNIAMWANGNPVNLLGAGPGVRVPHGFSFTPAQVYVSFEVGTNRQNTQVARLYNVEGLRNVPSMPTGVSAVVDVTDIDYSMNTPPPEDHVTDYYYDLVEEVGNVTTGVTKDLTRVGLPSPGIYTVIAQTENNSKIVGT